MEASQAAGYGASIEAAYGPNPLQSRGGLFPSSWGDPPLDVEERHRWIRRHAQLEHGYKNPRYLVEMLDVQVRNENRLRLLDLLAKADPTDPGYERRLSGLEALRRLRRLEVSP